MDRLVNIDEAKELLLAHGRTVKNPKADCGFVGMLCPYESLVEKNYHEVMASLILINEEVARSPSIDRCLISALWNIVNQSYSFGISPKGDLLRLSLISESDIETLTNWVETIELTIRYMLEGLCGKDNPQINAYKFVNEI